MTIGAFDLDQTLADLRSEEGLNPAMVIHPMPRLWAETLTIVFATEN